VPVAANQLTNRVDSCRSTGIAEWNVRTIPLRYSISYLKLFEIRFKALMDPRPFNPNRPAVQSATPLLDTVPHGFDVLVHRHQPLESRIPVIQRVGDTLCYAPRQLLHFYTDLQGGPEAASKGMSSKTRSTITRKVRKFKEFCGNSIQWKVYRTRAELEEFHALAVEVARKTYQQRLFDSGLPDSDAFRSEMADLAGRDLTRGFLLFHNEKAIAYLYTPAPDGFLIYDYLGYDPEYATWSPGLVLQWLALEAICAEQRFPLYYWGFGYSQTKEIFSTGKILAADLYFFKPTVVNVVAVWLHYTIDRLSETMGGLLDRLKLKQAIKQWLKK
jgi:hypothetical protein